MKRYDSVIIGSGPNGLACGIALAKAGQKVLIMEKAAIAGGGMRTENLTLEGFSHDLCSAVHPMGALSPYFNQLGLERFGLEWIYPEVSLAHPREDQPAVLLSKSLESTAAALGRDGGIWMDTFDYFVQRGPELMREVLKPVGYPGDLLLAARFGLKGIFSAEHFVKRFEGEAAKSLFMGCAAHSVLPLHFACTAAMGMVFALAAHLVNWPIAKGGSQSIAHALSSLYQSLGGELWTGCAVQGMQDLPAAANYIFDTDPRQLARIASSQLPQRYIKRLLSYNYGPGVFKIDWALSGKVPWLDPQVSSAGVVHIGGGSGEIAASEFKAWQGEHSQRPFIIYCQQSNFDSSRAPQGKHTGYAYCHVPSGSERDMTDVIENQIERFAPGFKSMILARSSTNTKEFYNYNPNYYKGAVTGGASDLAQMVRTPVWRSNPYTTPNPKLFICSASTPPGGGVHGMCGYWAAQAVLKRR